jgi:segregation and condensation protein B
VRLAETPEIASDDEKRVVEALIFVADEPVTLDQMAQVLGHRKPEELQALVSEIERELEGSARGLRIERIAGGYRFSTCPDLAPWVRAFFRNRNRARLSPASIETLAVIAYKQPVTAPEIQEIRGVDPQGSLKTLLDKAARPARRQEEGHRKAFLYATTREFLVHFGLASIDDPAAHRGLREARGPDRSGGGRAPRRRRRARARGGVRGRPRRRGAGRRGARRERRRRRALG